MKKWLKIIALCAVVALLSTTLLTACDTSSSSSSAASSASTSSKEEAKVYDECTLNWWLDGGVPNDLDDVSVELTKILQTYEEFANVTVKLHFIDWGDYDDMMTVKLNSQDQDVDIFFTCSWAASYVGNSRNGTLVNLDDYINDTTWGQALYSAVDQGFWDGISVDGSIYAVPVNKEMGWAERCVFNMEFKDGAAIASTDTTITINGVELQKDGTAYDIYSDEISGAMDYAYQQAGSDDGFCVFPLKGESPNGFTREYDTPTPDPWLGVRYDDTSYTVVNVFETDEAKSFFTAMKTYYDKGYINTDALTNKEDWEPTKRFIFCASGQPNADVIWSQQDDVKEESVERVTPIVTSSSTTGSMNGVASWCPNKEAAAHFLALVNTETKLIDCVRYGIEDVHYTIDDDGLVKLDKTGTDTGKYFDYNPPYFELGNFFNATPTDEQGADIWDKFKAFNSAMTSSVITGFFLNDENITAELAACKEVFDSKGKLLQCGQFSDLDTALAEYTAAMDAAGMQTVKEAIETQLAEWRATTGK